MPKDDADAPSADGLATRCERACVDLIEERWRRAPGLAIRMAPGEPAVVERPGRTRFDLSWVAADLSFSGVLRGRLPLLPLADGSLALVVLDRLAMVDVGQLKPFLAEVFRVLADDGGLMVIDTNPWSWLGLRARWRGAPRTLAANQMGSLLRASGLEDIEIRHALCWPPLPSVFIERHSDLLDRTFSRIVPAAGSIYSVCGRKRSSNVIAIPFARDRRHGLLAAPEGMRRAG